jgi:hypothetical protein
MFGKALKTMKGVSRPPVHVVEVSFVILTFKH